MDRIDVEPCGNGEFILYNPGIKNRFALKYKPDGSRHFHYQWLFLSIRGGDNQPRLEAAKRLYERVKPPVTFEWACG